ncbi:MAG: transporter substrate-binding domain-containing protein [Desulforhopalus sp.]
MYLLRNFSLIRSFRSFLLIVALFVFASSAFAGEKAASSNTTIHSASEVNYPPFSLIGADGLADGFSVELLRAALAAMGRDVTFHIGTWSEVRGLLERGEIDALPLVGRTPEREEIFDFTFPYMTLRGAIVVRQGTRGIRTLADLKGGQVAVMKGDNAEEFLRRKDHGINVHTTTTFEDALRELSEGRHDAVVMQRLVALRLLGESGITNLEIINNPIEGFQQEFCFAVREGNRQGLALLNEGLALVFADGTYRRLHAKWFAAMQLPADRPVIVGGDHNYPPFEYLNDKGQPTGFAVELTNAIASEMNLAVQIRLGPWADTVESLASGEIDAIQGMFYSAERERTFDFSPSYLLSSYIAVVRQGSGFPPESFEELNGKKLIVQKGDIILDVLAAQGLMNHVSVVETQEDVLRAVSDGNYDFALVPRTNVLYLIEKNGWTNLVPGRHSFFSGEYSYAVSNKNAALLAEFSEGLRILKESGEYRRIYEKWLGLYDESPPTFLSVLRYIAMVALPLLVLLLIFIFWWWSMRRQVEVRTRDLRKSMEFQRAMFTCSPVALYSVDHEGIVTAWNSSTERIFGWTADEIIGKPLPIVPEESQDEFKKILNEIINGSFFSGIELVRKKKDGTLFDCSLSAAPLLDHNGKVVGSMAAMEDLTERKRSQLRIEHLNRLLRTIRDVNQLIVREHDRDTLMREACDLLVNNHGYLSALIVMTDDHDLPAAWAFEGLAAESTELAALLKQGKLPPCCRHARNKKGVMLVNERPNICSDCPVTLGTANSQSLCVALRHDDKTYGYLAAATEINFVEDQEEQGLFAEMAGDFAYALNVLEREAEHRQGEMALRESESRFRMFAELAPVGVVILDDNEQTLFVSSKFTELFGYTLRDLPSVEEWWQLAYPNENFRERVRREWLSNIETAKRTHTENRPMEYPVTCKDGSVRQVVFRLATTGSLKFVVLIDISERKHAEEEREKLERQLIQAQKMESVGRLAGGVAHDYNNVLGVIIGFTELAMDKTAPDDPLNEDLQEVLNAARRATEITRQLLAFARKQTIAPQVLNLNDTLDSMLKMLRRLIGEDIDLSWRPRSGLWSVKIDPSQLDQLLANLCVNARDAIADVGKITIETRNVSFDEEYCTDHPGFSPGDFALLAVSDDGCGMDKEILDQLFEPFFTTKETGKGTGLGLATVYGIVKQNEGFINVYSEPGKGSTIKIYLPRHGSEAEGVREVAAAEIPQGQGETILIVEDEAAILRLAVKMLERQKYVVLEAATPGRAVEIAKEHGGAIDLLITDVIMPEMNGRDLANEMQVLYPELKVLFMSGYTADVIAHRGVLDEGVNFVQKPFSNHGLAIKVREVLTR